MTPQLFMRKLWQLNRVLPLLIATLALCNLAAFAVNHWLLAPAVNELQRTYIEQRDLARHGGTGPRSSLSRQMQRDREDLGAFRKVVGDRADFTVFIGELAALAERARLSINQVSYKPDEIAEHGLLRYGLSFSVSGDYGNIKKFVFSLEQSQRIIIIEEMTLAGSGEANSGVVNLKISLSTYFGTEKA